MLTLRQLEYIIAVDDERHFRKAAEKVNVSQPSLSAQIMQLEQRLGVEIFTRSKKGVFPSPTGQELISKARTIVERVEEFKDFAQRVSHPLSGRIRFGTPPTLGPYLLPHIVPQLHINFPDLKFIIKEETPSDLQKMVENGQLDIAITPLPLLSSNLQTNVIFTEEIYVGMAIDHPLSANEHVSPGDLQGEKILALVQGHHLHDQVKKLCTQYKAELLYDYEGGSLDALRHMVAMGAGLSFFPELYVLSEVSGRHDMRVLKVHGKPITREIAMIWRQDDQMSEELITICDMFKENVMRLLQAK